MEENRSVDSSIRFVNDLIRGIAMIVGRNNHCPKAWVSLSYIFLENDMKRRGWPWVSFRSISVWELLVVLQ
jgi:hypothetical protein